MPNTTTSEPFTWGYDLCWPREIPLELPDIFAGMRVRGGTARRENGRVVIESAHWKDIESALCGTHPLHRIRALLNDTGSRRWQELAEENWIQTRGLEELATRWPELGAAGEAVMLETALGWGPLEPPKEWDAATFRMREAMFKLARIFRPEPGDEARSELVRRIAELTPEALRRRETGFVELCLPFQAKGQNVDLSRLRPELGADGRIWVLRTGEDVSAQRNHFHALLACAGAWVVRRPAGFNLTFEDTRKVIPNRIQPEWLKVLSDYGFDGKHALAGFSPEKEVEATLHLRLPGSAVTHWTQVPADREYTYFDVFRPVAVAVQRTLRRWLPLAWFWDLDAYSDMYLAQVRLAYQATPVFPGRPRASFTYEVLDDGLRKKAVHGVRAYLPSLLASVRSRLALHGADKIARYYDGRALIKILNLIVRQRRTYDAFLIADTQCVSQMAWLATAGHTLRGVAVRDPARAGRGLAEFSYQLTTALQRRLRRLMPKDAPPELGTLLLMEATRALSGETIEAKLILRQGGRESTVRPIV